ncbi:MAG: DUF3486 family protein [Lachnospiraceae bacterium]|nr:DUF3486 family protein [Lachnospiraceae bacterium]
MGKHIRKHYAIDKLPPEIKETVDEMIKADFTYREIVDYIQTSGNVISISAVQRYAANFMQTLQNIRITQANFRAIMDETENYSNVDFTEPLMRLLCGQLLEQISNLSSEQLQELGIDEIIKNTIALTRAVAYKRSLDIKNKSAIENGADYFQGMLYELMAKENPKLYRELKKFAKDKLKELNCSPSE